MQWIQRGLPDTGAPPRWDDFPSSEPEVVGALVTQLTFAVTGVPWERASRMPSRTCAGPPMRSRSLVCRRPGMRRAGEVKVMRREGCGRTRRYCCSRVSGLSCQAGSRARDTCVLVDARQSAGRS